MTHDVPIHVHNPDPPRQRLRPSWPDALREKVQALWEHHSAAEIASILWEQDRVAFSRNSIISIIHRMSAGTPARPRKTNRVMPGPNPVRLLARKQRAEHLTVVPFRAEDFTAANVHGIADLQDHHCRFICNDDLSAPIYCGLPRVEGSHFWFCSDHLQTCTATREAR